MGMALKLLKHKNFRDIFDILLAVAALYFLIVFLEFLALKGFAGEEDYNPKEPIYLKAEAKKERFKSHSPNDKFVEIKGNIKQNIKFSNKKKMEQNIVKKKPVSVPKSAHNCDEQLKN